MLTAKRPTTRVTVIGAGIGGLVAALELAVQGLEVTLVERTATPGGKMREISVNGARLDAGPTVLTMRWVFEEIFAAAGTSLSQHLDLHPAHILARHAWNDRDRLDLFADIARSADAIGQFAGPEEARGYLAFCTRAASIYRALERSFIRASQPTPASLVRHAGLGGLGDLWGIAPFSSLWGELGRTFKDARLRQLFGRYATYCGSSPFQAPATLMLIAHVEQEGVWLVEGGMQRIAEAIASLAQARGATLRYATEATAVLVDAGRASGVRLAGGEILSSDAVIVNADTSAIADGLLGDPAAQALPLPSASVRSLSAVTWALTASTEGFPLSRHNVFFSGNYRAEFDSLFRHGRLPSEPTVYVCAQDRDGRTSAQRDGPERLFCLVNAPALGDSRPLTPTEIEQCTERSFGLLQRCGLRVHRTREATVVMTPTGFNDLYPGTGGALYGQATHGWKASFRRPAARTGLPGLYLAGGSVHPGAGVPMAALSGRMASACLLADLASTVRSVRVAMPGGISMR